ncbi:MAG: peptide-methionine (S)-S-oxide reductase MsrA [Nitrososphaerota archaeon]|nr:peptide-methionine (S)-S-oxide reductase MsrA [Nitrososphaerota archaeon]
MQALTPRPVTSGSPTKTLATFGSGCFWCSEAVFSELKGVEEAVPGYSGGKKPNPTYEEVCTDLTGHAEVVQITYRPAEISYRELLEIFFSTHDPTTLNRQGEDVGTQYRSVIFYHDPVQEAAAREIVGELTTEKAFQRPIVTQILPFEVFYPAEEYHRDYYRRNPSAGYCQAVISPKLAKFRAHFRSRLKSQS